MKIKDLEVLAANLYQEAEEATPLLGDGDKKEWMGHRLDTILKEQDDALNCLAGYDTISEVLTFLEKEYQERNNDNLSQDLPPCASVQPQNPEYMVPPTQEMNTVHQGVMAQTDSLNTPTGIIEEDIIIVSKVRPNPGKTNLPSSDDNFIC